MYVFYVFVSYRYIRHTHLVFNMIGTTLATSKTLKIHDCKYVQKMLNQINEHVIS
jgi:hypothetical protein